MGRQLIPLCAELWGEVIVESPAQFIDKLSLGPRWFHSPIPAEAPFSGPPGSRTASHWCRRHIYLQCRLRL